MHNHEGSQAILTVEVRLSSKTICQTRGKRNVMPDAKGKGYSAAVGGTGRTAARYFVIRSSGDGAVGPVPSSLTRGIIMAVEPTYAQQSGAAVQKRRALD